MKENSNLSDMCPDTHFLYMKPAGDHVLSVVAACSCVTQVCMIIKFLLLLITEKD